MTFVKKIALKVAFKKVWSESMSIMSGKAYRSSPGQILRPSIFLLFFKSVYSVPLFLAVLASFLCLANNNPNGAVVSGVLISIFASIFQSSVSSAQREERLTAEINNGFAQLHTSAISAANAAGRNKTKTFTGIIGGVSNPPPKIHQDRIGADFGLLAIGLVTYGAILAAFGPALTGVFFGVAE